MRLDKALTCFGLTRSQAKRAVADGRARVGGEVARDPGANVEIASVTFDGEAAGAPGEVHLMIYKPAGYLTATEDGRERTVMELLPDEYARMRLGPVGRLDRDVTGLLLLTTDGQLAHRLISPKRNVEKVYEAEVEGEFTEAEADLVRAGIEFKDFVAKPARVEILAPGRIRLTLTEGKYHEVKRICQRVGHPVIWLKRLSIGGVFLDPALTEGACRPLTGDEAALLYTAAGMENKQSVTTLS
jgi:16S rRNA pseudouridine516 synthase